MPRSPHATAAKAAAVEAQRIVVLDDSTIAQIAAGEVIERPVSVVKELVENSLDAGAAHVSVELVEGGREAIVVADDGSGIARDDLRLAFARHATSKLRSGADLFAIPSLGFRGEGLASIAAAGAVTLTSRVGKAEIGASVAARGVWVGDPKSVAAPLGTKVVVRELFALTPARREFLKSARAEFARVASFLSQIALGWPRVGFTLRHDGREVWTLQPVDDPVDRLVNVFGRPARGALVRIHDEDVFDRERITGYVCAPGHDRSNRNGQVFFVNRRMVRGASLSAAWLAGYGSFGMTGRYPFGVIALELPPEDVDVNVHPTKIEVRFAHAQAVFDAVRRAVARTLRAVEPGSTLNAGRLAPSVDRGNRPLLDRAVEDGGARLSFAPQIDPSPSSSSSSMGVRMLGQIDRTFIVAATNGELFILDQHAAHERVAYEAIVDGAGAEDVSAPLLFPSLVELTPERASLLHQFEEELRAAGVVVEPFGDGAFRISALPAGYEKRRFDLSGLLDDLAADEAPREGVAHRNRVLATIACHSVVRAGDALALQEQTALYDRLLRCRDPHTCPHGRPTMLRLGGAELAKAFKRL